jgi:LemA protein
MEPILIGSIVAFILIALWFLATYNRLIVMEQEVENAWSNIDVVLQERYDSLGNMARAAEDFAKGVEKDLFEQFAKARMAAATASQSGNVADVNAAEGMMAGILPKIFMVAEDHPDLTASPLYANVQEEIDEQNERIADRREFYNAKVRNWNVIIRQIPSNFVAMVMGAESKDYFDATNTENPELFAPSAREEKQKDELDAIEHEIEMMEAKKRLGELKRGSN